jgi:hypothetical protein
MAIQDAADPTSAAFSFIFNGLIEPSATERGGRHKSFIEL